MLQLIVDNGEATEEVVRRAKRRVVVETESIIAAMIEEAKQGKYREAKFLMDFAGLTNVGVQDPEQSKADAMLEQFLNEFRELAAEDQQPAAAELNH